MLPHWHEDSIGTGCLEGIYWLARVSCVYTNVSVTGTRSESMWFHDVDSEGAGSRLLMCYLKRVRSGEDLQFGPRPVTPHDI